jgi:hypothetical protein
MVAFLTLKETVSMTKRGIFISTLAMLALAAIFSTAVATEVRVGSMGGVGFYTHDNSNIFYFPGAIYSYSGQVYGEFRVKEADNSYTVGVNYPVGDYSVVGVYLNRPIPLVISADILDNVDVNQTTDLFYGTQMSQFDLGFKLSLGMDSYKRDSLAESPELKESARYIQFAVGASSDKMDIGAFVELPHAKVEQSGENETWSGLGFGATGRLFHGEGNTKLVPLIIFNTRKITDKISVAGSPKDELSDLNLGLGVGVNHQLNENSLFVGAIELFGMQQSKDKYTSGGTPSSTSTTTNSLTTLPGLYMGIESKIRPWLTGRLGAAQVWQISKTKDESTGNPAEEISTHGTQYNVSFGLGFNFGDFTCDAAINEGIFFDGPNFISGETNSLANRLAIIYKF